VRKKVIFIGKRGKGESPNQQETFFYRIKWTNRELTGTVLVTGYQKTMVVTGG